MIRKNYLIVNIIPLKRLPSQAPDYFSYFSKKKLKPGNLVQVEFKKKKIYGYVLKLEPLEKKRAFLKKEKINLKPVLKVINQNPILSLSSLSLAYWLKNYANISLSYALSLFFPYKKIIFLKNNFPETKETKGDKKFELRWQKELSFKDLENKKTLIIVPQDNYLKYLREKFKIENVISAKTSEKNFLKLIEKIKESNKEIFLATKNGIFLPWNFLEQIVIYDEGSFFYKEFFQPPYFDYRKIFLKFAKLNKITCLAIDQLPSFSLIKELNLKPEIKINFQRIDGLEEFEEKIKEFKKTIIFVPQKSFGQKLLCQYCHFSLICDNCQQFLVLSEGFLYCHHCFKKYNLPEICPRCQKETNFFLGQKGAEAIYEYLRKIGREALFLKKENQKLINFFKNHNVDLVGSLLLFNPEISAEAFFFFNFSQFYFSADIFLKEKFLRILDFFSQRVKNIFLVSEIVNPEIETKIKDGKIIDGLLKEREINNLPPYKRLVILKSYLKDLPQLQKRMMELKEKIKERNPELEIIGPVFSHPFKIKKRFSLELILKLEPELDFNLKKILENIDVEEIDIDAYQI